MADEDKATFSGAFGAATDYLWRGMTFSEHKPVVKGGMNYNSPMGLNLGAWVSTSQGYGSSYKTSTILPDPNNEEAPPKNENEENGLETFLSAKYNLTLGESFSIHLGSEYFYYTTNSQHRYGRSYAGLNWKTDLFKATLEAGSWDYASKTWPSDSDSLDYRVMLSVMNVHLMAIMEEDHFANETGYQYYEARTTLTPPEILKLTDCNFGITLGYADYENEQNAGWSSYFQYMLSLNKSVDSDFNVSLFFSDTTRENVEGGIPISGGTDRTVGLSFAKMF